MVLSTAKAIEVLYENAIDQYQQRTHMLNLTMHYTPDPGDFQNSNNIIWRPLEQHAPIKEGWDMTDQFGSVIEQYYPATLEEPKNDAWELRADNMRDMRFWERRGRASGRRQATFLNRRVAQLIVETGSLFYRTTGTTSGFDFVSEAGAIMDERQVSQDERYYVLNTRDNNTFSSELADRGTLADRPEAAYAMGYIGRNVASFDMYTGSYIPNLDGGTGATGLTVTADQSFVPEGSTGTGQNVQNVDYRQAVIAVSATTGLTVGDVITFSNAGTAVEALGLADKTPTGQPMTFRIVAMPSATSITVWPKPIAADDPALSAEQTAYANIDTRILSGATITRLNTDPDIKPNIFWAQDSIEIIGGQIPAAMLKQFGGLNVMSETMENGQVMYLIYDGTIEDLTFKARLFTWWGLVNVRPDANGIGVAAPA